MSERSCSNCSATIPDGAQFCTSCGTPAPTGAPPVPAAPAAGTDNTTVMPIAPAPAAPPAWTPGAPAPAPAQAAPPPPAAPAWNDPTTAQPATQVPAYQPPPPAPMPPTQPAPQAWTPPPPAAPPAPAAPQWQPQAPPTGAQPGPSPAWGTPAAGAAPQPAWPGAAPVGVAAKKKGNAFGGLLAFVGAILLLAGAFTPWVRTNIQAGVSGWKVSNDAKTVVALGAVSLILGLLAFAKVRFILFRLALIGMGIAAVVIAVVDIQSVKNDLPKALNPNFGVGLVLIPIGGLFLLLSGVFTKSKKVAS